MGSIKVYISDALDKKFREIAMRLYGYGRGSLSVATEKAFLAWFSQVSDFLEQAESIEDPVAAIDGMLSHVKKTGVKLQHEVKGIRAKAALGEKSAARR